MTSTDEPIEPSTPSPAAPAESPPSNPDTQAGPTDALGAFLYDSFVRYNPVYLFSAALVLGGLTLLLVDVAADDALGGLGVGAIAELYALALIGGAALLTRIGSRRVGVMLGLLAALYQCDLTMHTERVAFLGGAGLVGALVWTALFHLKLRLLAAALQLSPSRSALWVPSLGAAAIALLPQTRYLLEPLERTQLTALALFAVGACALYTHREIGSAIGYDYRGRRAILGTWWMWAGGAALHVAYWVVDLGISLPHLAPAALLLSTRWARSEKHVWATSGAVLIAAAILGWSSLPVTALMVAATLLLRACRAPCIVDLQAAQPLDSPYRRGDHDVSPAPALVFVRAEPEQVGRLVLGAIVAIHLAAWTELSPAQVWMVHVLWADLALVVACAVAFRITRHWQTAIAPIALATHLAIQQEWLVAPSTAAQAGTSAIGLGFALLGTSLAVAYWRARTASG